MSKPYLLRWCAWVLLVRFIFLSYGSSPLLPASDIHAPEAVIWFIWLFFVFPYWFCRETEVRCLWMAREQITEHTLPEK
jgi:hypothetical protein